MSEQSGKQHVSIVIAGHVDSGKSTTTGRLIYELGGIPEREMEKLRQKAKELGKQSFEFAFYMDTTKEEQARGVTIQCTTKEFFTDKYHYSIVDAPGHRDYVKNMITGSSQADVALLMVPADGNFVTALAKGNPKEGEVQGQTRVHSRLLCLLGIRQLIIGVNKMDTNTGSYKPYDEERFKEVAAEMRNVLLRTGWKKDQVEKQIPIIPLSGYNGDNLLKKSENMPWWNGVDVEVNGRTVHVNTIKDCLNEFVELPPRPVDKPARCPISGVYNIKGVGDVLTGRCESGTFKNGDEVMFLPTHTKTTPCVGKIFSMEAHHKRKELCEPGDNLGFNVKNLNKDNMPQAGDVMVLKKDTSVGRTKQFTAQVQILDHPGELKVGYSPLGMVRTSKSAMRLAKINWKVGKETGGQKVNDPVCLKENEMAEVVFEPLQPITLEPFAKCEGLGRIALLESNQPIMIGKVTEVVYE